MRRGKGAPSWLIWPAYLACTGHSASSEEMDVDVLATNAPGSALHTFGREWSRLHGQPLAWGPQRPMHLAGSGGVLTESGSSMASLHSEAAQETEASAATGEEEDDGGGSISPAFSAPETPVPSLPPSGRSSMRAPRVPFAAGDTSPVPSAGAASMADMPKRPGASPPELPPEILALLGGGDDLALPPPPPPPAASAPAPVPVPVPVEARQAAPATPSPVRNSAERRPSSDSDSLPLPPPPDDDELDWVASEFV